MVDEKEGSYETLREYVEMVISGQVSMSASGIQRVALRARELLQADHSMGTICEWLDSLALLAKKKFEDELVENPAGYFIKAVELGEPLPVVVKKKKHTGGQPPEPQKYWDSMKNIPQTQHPPMGVIYLLSQRMDGPNRGARAYTLVKEEWERQGCPLPEEFNAAALYEN